MTLLVVSGAFLAGAALAALGYDDAPLFAAVGLAGAAAGFALAKHRSVAIWTVALGLLVVAGALRYEAVRPPAVPGGIALHNDGAAVRFAGVIVDGPEQTERSQRFTLKVESLLMEDGPVASDGSVQVTTRPFPRYRYGDRLELRGELETPPSFDDFDYREYLARKGVVSLAAFPAIERVGGGGGSAVRRTAEAVRRPLSESLGRALPEPEAALAQGILLGERAAIPRDLTDDFNTAGISHLVAISGYNVMLVAGLAIGVMTLLAGRRQAVVLSVVVVWAFALFVGAGPPVLRAAAMASVMLGAVYAGRPGSALTAVAFAAAVLTAFDPLLLNDVGFQLSVAATAGIVLLTPKLQEILALRLQGLPGPVATYLAESTSVTVAASLFVLPVMTLAFGRVSLIGVPANLLAGLTFLPILISGAATALAGTISAELGDAIGLVAYLPLRAMIVIGRVMADVPGASLALGRGEAPAVVLIAGAVLALTAWLNGLRLPLSTESPRAMRVRWPLRAAAVLLLATGFVWSDAVAGSEERLRLTVLDVGQGDAILIETPSGHRILVDGGPSDQRLLQRLGAELSPRDRRIDLVVLTHGQDDHVTGLVELLQRYEVRRVLAGSLPGTSAAYAAWRDAVVARGVPVQIASAGQELDLGGVRLAVLSPFETPIRGTVDDLNNNSVVLRLTYGEVSFLLTGDIAATAEEALLRSHDLRSTVLKLAHHGSDGSSTPAFLDAVRPAVAVVSAGDGNNFGHPSPTTRLRLAGTPLLRTDLNGSVRFETDGRRLWTRFDRGEVERLGPNAER